MDFDKTPRNDGLTSEFTKLFGRFELKPDCYRKISFLSGELNISQNQAVIKLMEQKRQR